jgi:hypothetical protein
MRPIISRRTAGRAVVALVLLSWQAAAASAQSGTPYTWTGGGGDNNWFTTTNWSPNGTPGVAGATGNTDRALFDTAGSSVTAANLNSGFNLGAIATTGASGGLMTVNFNGNGPLTLNGGYTVGSFTNVIAAAQNGRDLAIVPTNMAFAFGTPGNASTFYADAGRTLSIVDQQINNLGGAVNKEGAGTLVLGGTTGLSRNLGGATININGGTLAARDSMTNVTQVNVASGAALQAGLTPGGVLSVSAPVTFATNSSLRILTDGTTAGTSQFQNAAITKGSTDTFQIVLSGLSPVGTQTFTPNAIIVQASSLSGFDPNGTYDSVTNPGHFVVTGDGFAVTAWTLDVENNNQIRLISVTAVPEPASVLFVVAAVVGLLGSVKRCRQPSGAGSPESVTTPADTASLPCVAV